MAPYGSRRNTSKNRGRAKRKKKKPKQKKRRTRTSKVITPELEQKFVSDLEKRSGKPITEWFEILKKFDPQRKLLEDELGLHLVRNFRVGKWDGRLIAFYYQHPERLKSAD